MLQKHHCRLKTDSVKITNSTAGSSMSAGTSVASSECSDEAFVDSDSLFAVSEDQEYLSSSFYNILDANTISGMENRLVEFRET